MPQLKFKEKVWLYAGKSSWFFISLPKIKSKAIKKIFKDLMRPFSSIKVNAQIGETKWDTSIFYDKKRETFLLPLKSSIRKMEKIINEEIVEIYIDIKI